MVEECDVDEFILMYIKNCIEHDEKYEWYEAPMIRVSLFCERCRDVRLAAEFFERRKIASLKALIDGLIDRDRLTFVSYRYIFESFIGMLSDRMDAESSSNEPNGEFSVLCFPLMSIISFTGIYARRLVELDYGDATPVPSIATGDQADEAVLNRRNYRYEIYQLSIYSSHMLQNKFHEFKTRYDYSWSKFVDDTRTWLKLMYEDERGIADQNFPSVGNLLYVSAAVIVATVALFAVNHHRTPFKWFLPFL